MRTDWRLAVACLALSSCTSARAVAARTGERDLPPSAALLHVPASASIYRVQGAAPSRPVAVVLDAAEPGLVRAFREGAQGWSTFAQHRRSLTDEGTFEVEEGYRFDRLFDADADAMRLLMTFTQAQGAVDPRTITRSLVVLSLRGATLEPVLECQLDLTVVTGPERETVSHVERGYRVERSTLVVFDAATGRALTRATLAQGRFLVEGEPLCTTPGAS